MKHMEQKKDKFPTELEYNNSAGRLIALLRMFQPTTSYYDNVASFYEGSKNDVDFVSNAYLQFMYLLKNTYDDFVKNLTAAENISGETKGIVFRKLANLNNIIFPTDPTKATRTLSESEVSVLQMVASLMDTEKDITEDDIQSIRNSIENLQETIDKSDLSKSAREALLELVRLTRNALEQYNIYGARGFKKAFKKMLAELMEVCFKEGKEVQNQPWWNDAVKHLKVVDKVASKLLEYKPLLESVTTLFIGES